MIRIHTCTRGPGWLRRVVNGWFRAYERGVAQHWRCVCVERFTGSWEDIPLDRVALFHPMAGYSAEKYCRACRGTGVLR